MRARQRSTATVDQYTQRPRRTGGGNSPRFTRFSSPRREIPRSEQIADLFSMADDVFMTDLKSLN